MPLHFPNGSARVEWYVAAVFALGAVAFTLSFFAMPLHDTLGMVTVAIVTAVAERVATRLYHDGRISVSLAGGAFAVLSFGPAGGALVAAGVALGSFGTERNVQKLAFNFGQVNLSFAAAAAAAYLIGVRPDSGNAGLLVTGGAITGAVCFVVTIPLVTAVISMVSHRSPLAVYRANFHWLWVHHIGLGVVGGGLALAYNEIGPTGPLVLAVPVLLARYAIKQTADSTRDYVEKLEHSNAELQTAIIAVRDMSEELDRSYTGTIETLVAALDVRDQETRGHSVRVGRHSLEIAQMLGIRDEAELQMIYRGALMHDVGKIGVPDAILLKPGTLTDEEWEFMRKHSAMGYKILAQVPYLRPAARIVLAHHERWDGAGYPRRLKGDDIPLGSRIFAICDTYDAIISDRPYRKGQPPEAALAEIVGCAGTQFDPKVVEAFEALFPAWEAEDPSQNLRPIYLPAHAAARRKHDGTDRDTVRRAS